MQLSICQVSLDPKTFSNLDKPQGPKGRSNLCAHGWPESLEASDFPLKPGETPKGRESGPTNQASLVAAVMVEHTLPCPGVGAGAGEPPPGAPHPRFPGNPAHPWSWVSSRCLRMNNATNEFNLYF